jgi:DNA-binding LacI/PurR family transcriptional regulator
MTEPQRAAAHARSGVRDVARVAGVSTQTVSRVLNGHANVRLETRERVLAAMSDLGYRVNNAARSLGTRTTRTLGVIASDATLYGPSAGIAALETAARAVGRWIATAYATATSTDSVLEAAERLLAQGVDGLIVLAPHTTTLAALEAAYPSIPLTALHTGAGAERQEEGAALAARHLIGLGHRRIAHLAGPEDWVESSARDAGVDRALAAAGLQPLARWRGDWSAASGASAAPGIAGAISSETAPTAIIVANDQMALGLIGGLRSMGIDVPQRVSVTGFDDNADAAFYTPPLTTVRLDLVGEARRAVADAMADSPPPLPRSPLLIVRGSTAPAG